MARYEMEPLLRLCAGQKDVLAERIGVSKRTIDRWIAAGGLTEQGADEVAVRCGLHPGDLWSAWWD